MPAKKRSRPKITKQGTKPGSKDRADQIILRNRLSGDPTKKQRQTNRLTVKRERKR